MAVPMFFDLNYPSYWYNLQLYSFRGILLALQYSVIHLWLVAPVQPAGVTSVVNEIGYSTLDGLGQLLLDFLWHNGGITTVFRMCPISGLVVGVWACRVDLDSASVICR